MQRAAILIILMVIILMMMAAGLASAEPCLASEPRPVASLDSAVKVIGVERHMLDTYAIDVSMAAGVRLRDVYALYRNDEKIAEGVVVHVGPLYTLITLRQQNVTLKRGDLAVRSGRSTVIRRLAWKPSAEVVVLTERNVRSTAGAASPSGMTTSFSGPTAFSGSTSFSGNTSFSGSTNFSASTSFTGSTTYSGSTSFSGSTAYADSVQFNGSTSYSGPTSLSLPTSLSICGF